MAVTALEVPFRADIRHYSKHRLSDWVRPLTIGLLLIAVLAVGVHRLTDVYGFQPFGAGSGGVGPRPFHGAVQTANDGLTDTQYVLQGVPGVTGMIEYPLGNNSDQDVRVLGLGSGSLVTALHWSDLRDPFTTRSFPMTIKAHDSLTLMVTVTKPGFCGDGTFYAITGIPIRYEALGVTHTYVMPLSRGESINDGYLPIDLCVPTGITVHAR